ncbi:MAG: cation diffusion facilitator family transporter [Bacillota bacterium]
MEGQSYRKGERITFYCLLGNLVLSLLKGLAGFLGGSKAMIADAFHSGSDTLATFVVYVCLKISRKPADGCHPYGHGKVEPLAAAFVGVTLLLAAALIIQDIVTAVFDNSLAAPSLVTLAAAAGSILVKEIMFRITYHTGVSLNSEAMIANAWDHRSDAYSSVAVFCGILGSILGVRYGIIWLKYLDPLAGVLVAVLIFKIALEILTRAIRNLMDASPTEETMALITRLAQSVPGVSGVSWARGRVVGAQIYVDMAVQVEAKKSVQEGHSIARSITDTLKANAAYIGEVLIHINPHQEDES